MVEREVKTAYRAFTGLTSGGDSTCLTEDELNEGLNKFQWKIKDYYDQNGRLLFNSYDLDNTECLGYRDFGLMLITEVTNNNKDDAICEYCMVDSKREMRALFGYLDADGNGLVTAEGLYNAITNQFETEFKITPGMANHFILINDRKGKAAVNRKEFVDGCLLGMVER